jgi:hypothetical protein
LDQFQGTKQPGAKRPPAARDPRDIAPRPSWTAEQHNALARGADTLTTTTDYSLHLKNARDALTEDGETAAAELREIARLHGERLGHDHPSAQRLHAEQEAVIAEVLGSQSQAPSHDQPEPSVVQEPEPDPDAKPGSQSYRYTPEEMFDGDAYTDDPPGTALEEFANTKRSRAYMIRREEYLREMDERHGGRKAFFEGRAAALNESEETLMAAMETAAELDTDGLSDDAHDALEAELDDHIADYRRASEVLAEYAFPAELIGDPDLDAASALHHKPSGLEMALDAGTFGLALTPGKGQVAKVARTVARYYGLGKSATDAYSKAQSDYANKFGADLKAAGVDPTDGDAVRAFAEDNTEFTRQAMMAAQIDTVLNFAIDQGIGEISGAAGEIFKTRLQLPDFAKNLGEGLIGNALGDTVDSVDDVFRRKQDQAEQ